MGLKDESVGFWKIIRSSWLVHRKTITPAPAESPGSTSWTRVSGSTMNRCCCHCVGLRAEDDERANVIGAECMLRWGSVLSGCRHGMSALFEVLGRPRPSVSPHQEACLIPTISPGGRWWERMCGVRTINLRNCLLYGYRLESNSRHVKLKGTRRSVFMLVESLVRIKFRQFTKTSARHQISI